MSILDSRVDIMRLFFGIDLSKEAAEYLTDVINQLRSKAETGKFLNPDLIHLTIEFRER